MTEQDMRNIAAVRRLYEQEKEVIAPDIVWHVPGHNPVSGVYTGEIEYFDIMPARMAPLSKWDFNLRSVMVNGDYVVANFHVQGERRDKTIDMDGSHILRLNDQGAIVEGWGFAEDQDALDDFFTD